MKKSLAILPLLALFAVGCSKPGLEGKWNMTGGAMNKSQAAATITYTPNRFTLVMDLSQFNVKITATGTYKLDGEKLTQTTDDVTIDDSKAAPQLKAIIKANANPEKIKEQMNSDKLATVKFTDADTAVMNGGKDGDVTLVRIKGA